MKKHKHYQGFTVIELLIVLVVVGIIARVAVSSYQAYVFKSHREDGINAILTLQLAEERYRASNTTYGSIAQIGGSATSPQSYYALSISGTSATGYTITATGQGTQANDVDGATSCTTLTLAVANATVTQTPAACWPS